ncbi:hypothetical protein Hamer_G017247 [Homarus americanus]|uniref:Uncharacterized protein n=1 Tax=Homarus americanus TaxID=6706 RepID=A0A8J5MUG6_HOMAM|nr:hypothetical protein Hamer_G017247 [Homarus americanus]
MQPSSTLPKPEGPSQRAPCPKSETPSQQPPNNFPSSRVIFAGLYSLILFAPRQRNEPTSASRGSSAALLPQARGPSQRPSC